GIVGLATALEHLCDVVAEAARLAHLRDTLEQGLARALPAVHVWGQGAPRLPGTTFFRCGLLQAEVVLQRLERLGIAASSGAACSSAGNEPSHVLTAMGVARDEALGAVRLSLGRTSTLTDVEHLLQALPPLLMPLLQDRALAATV
ncbi:MAG TPA: aminotransferase class V-fold PLP-dependent enzyme, partial [Burkholderiaceae bacterium]